MEKKEVEFKNFDRSNLDHTLVELLSTFKFSRLSCFCFDFLGLFSALPKEVEYGTYPAVGRKRDAHNQ